jgi:hypothetical protein
MVFVYVMQRPSQVGVAASAVVFLYCMLNPREIALLCVYFVVIPVVVPFLYSFCVTLDCVD